MPALIVVHPWLLRHGRRLEVAPQRLINASVHPSSTSGPSGLALVRGSTAHLPTTASASDAQGNSNHRARCARRDRLHARAKLVAAGRRHLVCRSHEAPRESRLAVPGPSDTTISSGLGTMDRLRRAVGVRWNMCSRLVPHNLHEDDNAQNSSNPPPPREDVCETMAGAMRRHRAAHAAIRAPPDRADGVLRCQRGMGRLRAW